MPEKDAPPKGLLDQMEELERKRAAKKEKKPESKPKDGLDLGRIR